MAMWAPQPRALTVQICLHSYALGLSGSFGRNRKGDIREIAIFKTCMVLEVDRDNAMRLPQMLPTHQNKSCVPLIRQLVSPMDHRGSMTTTIGWFASAVKYPVAFASEKPCASVYTSQMRLFTKSLWCEPCRPSLWSEKMIFVSQQPRKQLQRRGKYTYIHASRRLITCQLLGCTRRQH